MAPKAADILAEVAARPFLKGRTPETPDEEGGDTFAVLAETERTGVYAGSFQGRSPWERHRNGDEMVQVLDGAAEVTIVVDGEPTVLSMTKGTVTVVPKGCWHRFDAPDGVTVMTMTPGPTDHVYAEDLPAEELRG